LIPARRISGFSQTLPYLAPNPPDNHSNIYYAIGSAAGPIKLGDLVLAGYTIPNQAYLEVPAGNGVPGTQGVIGLGPAAGSGILETLFAPAFATEPVTTTQALGMAPPLDRIFANGSVPAFITSTCVFLLKSLPYV
jgi:hypothetical protein